MAFSLPTFNLLCNVWSNSSPVTGPPRAQFACNLAWGRRVQAFSDPAFVATGLMMTLLLPAGTDIRSYIQGGGGDWVEVPAGSGRRYLSYSVDDIGKGFDNEHRAAVLVQDYTHGAWPTPMP